MKARKKILIVSLLLLMALPFLVAFQVEEPPPTEPVVVEVIEEDPTVEPFTVLFTIVGFGALGVIPAMITNLLKTAGAVPDGEAPMVSAIIGSIMVIVILAIKWLAPGVLLTYEADILAGADSAVKVIGVLIQLISTIGGSRLLHEYVLKGLPGVGKSRSFDDDFRE